MQKLWAIALDLPRKPEEAERLALEAALEPFGEALSSFEVDDGRAWKIEVFSEQAPDRRALAAVLKPLGTYRPQVNEIVEKDWVAESERGLPPISAGPFFIHGSHFTGRKPKSKITFEIDAGMAFGTGRHETTRGCLLALSRLSKTHRLKNGLDIGCGTGILAFAMVRLWGRPVIAGDNDKDAVRITRENARLNGLQKSVRVLKSDGYRAKAIQMAAPFDLVTANILAGPLIDLAPDLKKVLARSGRAVLSGLLRKQEKDVLAAHEAQGLELDFRLRLKEWSVLVLTHRPKALSQRS